MRRSVPPKTSVMIGAFAPSGAGALAYWLAQTMRAIHTMSRVARLRLS